jgi:hypothetical protein
MGTAVERLEITQRRKKFQGRKFCFRAGKISGGLRYLVR